MQEHAIATLLNEMRLFIGRKFLISTAQIGRLKILDICFTGTSGACLYILAFKTSQHLAQMYGILGKLPAVVRQGATREPLQKSMEITPRADRTLEAAYKTRFRPLLVHELSLKSFRSGPVFIKRGALFLSSYTINTASISHDFAIHVPLKVIVNDKLMIVKAHHCSHHR